MRLVELDATNPFVGEAQEELLNRPARLKHHMETSGEQAGLLTIGRQNRESEAQSRNGCGQANSPVRWFEKKDLKEKNGWKAPAQNSKLWQEVV